jgi:CRP-like cAMP-binding protein
MQPFVKTYKKGMTLFHENDHRRELYLIQSGSVKVYRKINNREIELAVLKKGAVLGEMALIDGKPRSASAVAREDCSVILIDADTFHEKISGVPQWFMSVIRTTSEKIRKANSRLDSACNQNRGLHIALALKYFFAQSSSGKDGQKSLDLNTALRQLTQLLCTTHQRIMTILEILQKSGLVEIQGNRLFLRSSRAMDDYCLFLRRLGRKAFDKIGVVSEQSKKVLAALRDQMTLGGDGPTEKQKTMTGEDLTSIIAQFGLEKNCMEIIGELANRGIAELSKTSTEQPGERPLAGRLVTIDNAAFEKHFLFSAFGPMAPSL